MNGISGSRAPAYLGSNLKCSFGMFGRFGKPSSSGLVGAIRLRFVFVEMRDRTVAALDKIEMQERTC